MGSELASGDSTSVAATEWSDFGGSNPVVGELDQLVLFDVSEIPEVNRPLAESLFRWWMDRATAEVQQVVPKAVEYGNNSLIDLGYQLARYAHRTVSAEEAQELGCWFYIVGKMGRWADALVDGTRVSDDTIHDISVYCRMVQRIRTTGSWPGEVG